VFIEGFDIRVKILYSEVVQTFYEGEFAMERNATPAPEVIRLGQLEIRYLQHAGSGCDMGMFEMIVPPGSNVPPPHSHAANEEIVYVLEGTLRYTVGRTTRDLHAGDSMATPRGEVHAFGNAHETTARALVVNTPDIGAAYFREVAALLGAGGPPDRARLIATMQRFGLTPAAPAAPSVAA
jgi:quercetin dioxygenase-like cupin family protein